MPSDPKFAPGQVKDGRVICGAKTKAETPCGLNPLEGGTRCKKHGGGSPQARKAAEKRIAEAKAKVTMEKAVQTLGLPVDIDPGKALLDEIAVTYGHVQWLRGKVQDLTPDELVWGVTQTDEGIGPQGPVDTKTEKAAPNVWYTLYMTEREHLVKVTTTALKAGIEERRVKLAESQGQLLAEAIRRILAALNLSPAQQAMVPEIVPQQLRLLAGGNAL